MVSKVNDSSFGIKIDRQGELITLEFSEEVQKVVIPYEAAADIAVDLMNHAKAAHEFRIDRQPQIIMPNRVN